jgi:hypothetical protein
LRWLGRRVWMDVGYVDGVVVASMSSCDACTLVS